MQVDVFVVSTSRFMKFGPVRSPEEAEDGSGRTILDKVIEKGYDYQYRLVPDGVSPLKEAVSGSQADFVVICGGTGLAPLDLTLEAIEPLYEKIIPGFGEIFRLKSMEVVGTRAMLTRASAGVCRGKPVFCLPGSPNAAGLGIELILSEIEHILKHIRE